MNCKSYVIRSKKSLAKGIFDMWIDCPDIAKEAKPGQFVDVKIDDFTLRRPISICEIDAPNGLLRLVFEIRGEGTERLAETSAGGSIDILGPLGNGFMLGKTDRPAVFVGGGIGVPPLLAAAKPFFNNATAILGFRSANAAILHDDFKKSGCNVTLCTDDGTAGQKGFVTAALEERLKEPCAVVFACGPKLMLQGVARLAAEKGIPCFVSMEERMACGIGACLSCACKVMYEGSEKYFHVCKNGPIFDAQKVVW